MAPSKMPLRSSKNAPFFSGNPHELADYLEDVKQQCEEAAITDEDKLIKWSCHYAPLEVRTSWEACGKPSTGTTAVTYIEFTKAVHEIYPGSDSASRYVPADLENFARKQAREAQIQTREQLGGFARTFMGMVSALMASGQISGADVSRCFFLGLGPELENSTRHRLETRYPDHRPTMPYTSAEIISAADWVLPGSEGDRVAPAPAQPTYAERGGSGRASRNPFLNSSFREGSATVPVPVVEIKTEPADPATIQLQQTVAQLATQLSSFMMEMRRGGTPVTANQAVAMAQKLCAFCQLKPCNATKWELCDQYNDLMSLGLIRNNAAGRTEMRDGSSFPRGSGSLAERIRRAYQNQAPPSNEATTQSFLLSVFPQAATRAPSVETVQTVSSNMLSTFGMEVVGRQGPLEDQLAAYATSVRRNLQGKNRVMSTNAVTTRSNQRNKPPPPAAGKGLDPASRAEESYRAPSVPAWDEAGSSQTPADTQGTPPGVAKITRAPFPPHPGHIIEPRDRSADRRAEEVQPSPVPVHRAVQATPTPRERVPARQYRALAPSEDISAADRVLGLVLDGASTVNARDLLAISPDLRRLLREYVTPRHRAALPDGSVPPVPSTTAAALLGEIAEEDEYSTDDIADYPATERMYEVMQYTLPDNVVVAGESASLRAVTVLVNGSYEVEGILDGGSQLVSMSEAVWRVLGIPLDSSIVVRVQSANGGIERSLGMCRHVPFMVGGITIYLQVHVVPGAMYNILLGRPFMILVEAVLKDYQDGGQTLELKDPNSDLTIAIPTHGRGCPQFTAGSMQVSRAPLIHMRAAVAINREDTSD